MNYEDLYKEESIRVSKLLKQIATKDKVISGLAKDIITLSESIRSKDEEFELFKSGD